MGVVVVSVLALVVAVVVAGIVVVGMRGELPEVSEKSPGLAGRFEWAAKQLSGEGPPPEKLAKLEKSVDGRLRRAKKPAAESTAEESGAGTPGVGTPLADRTRPAAPESSASRLPDADFGSL